MSDGGETKANEATNMKRIALALALAALSLNSAANAQQATAPTTPTTAPAPRAALPTPGSDAVLAAAAKALSDAKAECARRGVQYRFNSVRGECTYKSIKQLEAAGFTVQVQKR